MKKVLFINGSPRKKGNTSLMIKSLEKKTGTHYSSESVFLQQKDISGCIDCRACKKGDMVCTFKDDMQEIYPLIENADVLVFATPIYWFGPTAQMKALIDRLRPYYGNQRLKGKHGALLLPAGVGRSDCNFTIRQFKKIFKALGIEYLMEVTPKAFNEGEYMEDKEAMKDLEKLSELLRS